MDASVLDNLPSKDQLQHFDERGFLIVPNALSEEKCDRLEILVDAIWEEQKACGNEGNLFYPTLPAATRLSSISSTIRSSFRSSGRSSAGIFTLGIMHLTKQMNPVSYWCSQ